MEKNIVWHSGKVLRKDREKLLKQKGAVLWFTGLSGSGKSTVAHEVEARINEVGKMSYILDGDNIRHGLNSNLSFSEEDRKENIRRIGETAKLFADAGIITLTAFISPFKVDRDKVREINGVDFIEIHIDCPIEECERRDVKGLYKKARNGEIKDFTGIRSPYEAPERPEIVIRTAEESLEESVEKIIGYLKEKGII